MNDAAVEPGPWWQASGRADEHVCHPGDQGWAVVDILFQELAVLNERGQRVEWFRAIAGPFYTLRQGIHAALRSFLAGSSSVTVVSHSQIIWPVN